MLKKERKYYVAIVLVVIAYLVVTLFFDVEIISKKVTTVIALISAVTFWLQLKRSERLNESSFIMNLNNQFIGNKDMTMVEHELELYYNQFEATSDAEGKVSLDHAASLHLGLSQSRTNDDCQKMIDYLVYLEAMAALVDRQVIHLDVIDDLFSYRFFLAVNNPVVQENELLPYADFFRGIYKLSERWVADHRKRNIPIPMEQFCLIEQNLNALKKLRPIVKLDISSARGSDSKLDIARCIYGTDRYIYPSAFGDNVEKATKAVSRLIGLEGSMLDYKNLLVARYNGEVCGVCVISNGTERWDVALMQQRIGNDLLPERLKYGFDNASRAYFMSFYQEKPDQDTIELVACSVDEGFRRKHIGRAMLEELISRFPDKRIRLGVLCDNRPAIALYEQMGFRIVGDAHEGFAAEGLQKPMCYTMVKLPDSQ